jgi:chorismate synthase
MLRFLTAGESHGPALTVILDGLPAGLKLSSDEIFKQMKRRQSGLGAGGRMKIEQDSVQILGGVMRGETIGAPLALLVENADHKNWKGKAAEPLTTPRPGHADLTGSVKYGFRDLRPALERASARETAMRVVVGAICECFLMQFGILIGGYVISIGEYSADLSGISYLERIKRAELSDVRCPDGGAAEKMHSRIEQIRREKDTLGGVIEVVAIGVPVGLGSYTQWDRRLDARLGGSVLGIQAIKGVEIGDAWENSHTKGTLAHDAIDFAVDSPGELTRTTNHAGGIEGGISNGQPIIVRVAMKPIASTLSPQATVDLATGQAAVTQYERSDFCPVPRAVPIIESMVAFVLADALIEKLGGDSMEEMLPRFASLKKARLDDLTMDNQPSIWWE